MKLNDDLPVPWILVKGGLFLVLSLLAGGLLLLERPDLRTAVLIAVLVWAACRFYYFLFYVIERYVDDSFRFAGVWSMVQWLLKRGSQSQ